MNVATALNKKYVLYTGVMLYSLAVNHPGEHIDFYVLHSELEEEDFAILSSGVEQFDISIIPLYIDSKDLSQRLPTTVQWSIEAYYRLFLAERLPAPVERILYLDVDMIVNKSLTSLYHLDFQGAELVVCADMCGVDYHEYLNKQQIKMFSAMLDQGYQYFNSGFLLMNIKRLREQYNFAYYLKVAEEDWNFQMHAPDQDLLNYIHGPRVAYVDYGVFNLFARIAHVYGVTYEEAVSQCAIIHFAGDKPWETTDYHYDIEKIWWEYARETVFYPQLMESFLEKTICDHIVEERFKREKERNNRLIEINKNLLK